jgi:DHA1 family multidrug resistance protein-like MFS transporter
MPEPESAQPGRGRDFAVIAAAQFAMAFALNFMFVFLPFYIRAHSTLDEPATLRWTGLILGAAGAMATFGSAFWGNLTERFSPKSLFERGLLSHAVMVLLMAFTTDLRLLLLIRLTQGFLGGISTIGLIIVSAISSQAELSRRMGTYQSALTLGQIFGPPLGAMAATALGFQGAFFASGTMLFAICLFCHLTLDWIPPRPRPRAGEAPARSQVWWAWLISLVGTMHLAFLPSILPAILRDLAVGESSRVPMAGLIVFAYGISAAAGSYGFSRLAEHIPARQLILGGALGAAFAQVLLYCGADPISFTLIRMLQTGCAGGIFPLILTQVAAQGGGRTIGFVNTARFAGMAVGPVTATFILAHADLLTLYGILGLTLAGVALGNHFFNRSADASH